MVDGLQRPQGIVVADGPLYIVDAGAKEVVAVDLNTNERHTIASGLPVGPPPGRGTQAAQGNAAVLRTAGPVRGHHRRAGRHPVRFGRRRRQRAGAATGGHVTVTPADHRYLQVARTLRKEIVDGVYPVGSQLPTEHELCERFAVSRYTVREALRRLRDDNLVASRPRAGTLVVPRPATNSYAQDVMSIDDLLAFATGAQFTIESNAMVTIDDDLAAGPAWRSARSGWRCAATGRPTAAAAPVCKTEYYINRAFAAVGRLLQRHSGPIFPLIEDLFGVSVVEVHQEISAIATSRELADLLEGRNGQCRTRDATHLHDVGR